jgi:hypothetical protein
MCDVAHIEGNTPSYASPDWKVVLTAGALPPCMGAPPGGLVMVPAGATIAV